MKMDIEMIDLRITYELGKSITKYKFDHLPEKIDYETALEVIGKIQEVMNLALPNYQDIYEKIGYILGDSNIYYCAEKY